MLASAPPTRRRRGYRLCCLTWCPAANTAEHAPPRRPDSPDENESEGRNDGSWVEPTKIVDPSKRADDDPPWQRFAFSFNDLTIGKRVALETSLLASINPKIEGIGMKKAL